MFQGFWVRSCSEIPGKGLRNPRGGGFPWDCGALLLPLLCYRKFKFFTGFLQIITPGWALILFTCTLEKGRKIKKQQNGNRVKILGFFTRSSAFLWKNGNFLHSAGLCCWKSQTEKWYKINPFWLISKNSNITQNLSVCKIWAAQFWKGKREGLGTDRAVLGHCFYNYNYYK